MKCFTTNNLFFAFFSFHPAHQTNKNRHEADMKVSRVSKSHLMHCAPSWMAPELLAAREISAKADVYSFGILLWEMFTREIPYTGRTVFQVKYDTYSIFHYFFPEIPFIFKVIHYIILSR